MLKETGPERVGGARRVAKAIGRASRNALFAAAFAASAAQGGGALAQEKPKAAVEIGAGMDALRKEPRAIMIAGAEVQLPARMGIAASAGFQAPFSAGGQAGLEEFRLKIRFPIAGPVTAETGFFRSVHDGVSKGAFGATVMAGLPHGLAAGVSASYVLDFNQVTLLGIGVANPTDWLSIALVGGGIPQAEAGCMGASIGIKLNPQGTQLVLDSWNIIGQNGPVVANLKLGIKQSF
jgi:hypothetical protein